LPIALTLWYALFMECLVTGGAGFIGSQLAVQLESLGHTVTIWDDYSSGSPQNLGNFKGEIQKKDLSVPFNLDKNYEVIFHQAAITDPRYPDDKELYRKNVSAFETLLDICHKKKIKLIYASTAAVYGNGPTPMKESQNKDCQTAYANSKLKMDEMAQAYFDKFHVVGLRYFNVFGPHEEAKGRPASMIYHLWHQMREGKRPRIFEWGEQVRDFIYVKDVVDANLAALAAVPGIYNVGTGVGTSFNDLVLKLNKALNRNLKPDYFKMPYNEKTYQSHTVADIHLAKSRLKFEARWTLDEAIRNYQDFLMKRKEEKEL